MWKGSLCVVQIRMIEIKSALVTPSVGLAFSFTGFCEGSLNAYFEPNGELRFVAGASSYCAITQSPSETHKAPADQKHCSMLLSHKGGMYGAFCGGWSASNAIFRFLLFHKCSFEIPRDGRNFWAPLLKTSFRWAKLHSKTWTHLDEAVKDEHHVACCKKTKYCIFRFCMHPEIKKEDIERLRFYIFVRQLTVEKSSTPSLLEYDLLVFSSHFYESCLHNNNYGISCYRSLKL